MAKAKDVKKGMVVALEGGYWVVEEYHSQHQGRRGAVLHIKMRNLKSGHVIDRTFGEGDLIDEPEMQTRRHQFSYADKSRYVFLDLETFEEAVVPAEMIGSRKWMLKEGSEFPLRLIEGRVADVVFPVNFVDEVVETAAAVASGHDSHVMKEAKLACGLTISVPQFIKVGERISVETETHKYLRRE